MNATADARALIRQFNEHHAIRMEIEEKLDQLENLE